MHVDPPVAAANPRWQQERSWIMHARSYSQADRLMQMIRTTLTLPLPSRESPRRLGSGMSIDLTRQLRFPRSLPPHSSHCAPFLAMPS
jgi:hypothetical protein